MSRAWFVVCQAGAWILRSATYSTVDVVERSGRRQVHKRRSVYAPLILWMSRPLVTMLGTGFHVLGQRDWHDRERDIYRRLYGLEVRTARNGTLVLPWFEDRTLAAILEDATADEAVRLKAIELAAAGLADLHRRGLTHADAMAENVFVDLDARVARWFDFETAHDPGRPVEWRRADDLRALLMTCVARTPPEKCREIVRCVLDAYADGAVARTLAAGFESATQRALPFHLAQATLSFHAFEQLRRLLRDRFRDIYISFDI